MISCNEKRWCPLEPGENTARVQGSDRGESMEGGGEGTRRSARIGRVGPRQNGQAYNRV